MSNKIKSFFKNKENLRFVLMLILGLLLGYHILSYSQLMEYEEIPDQVLETTGKPLKEDIDFGLKIIEDINSTQIIIPQKYIVDFNIATKRDNLLLNIIIELFVISLLWRKPEDD